MGGLNDPTKSVLEIALPALVGFKPVSLACLLLALATRRSARAGGPRTAAGGF